MMRLFIVWCCLILAGCAGRAPTYTYDVASRVALLNATDTSAQYYSFKAVTHESQGYPVSWGIPQLVERAVRFSTPNSFIAYPAPNWLRTFDLNLLESQLGPKGSPLMQESLAEACNNTSAEALLILGTAAVNWAPESDIPKKTKGYGMFTASGSYQRPYFAYAIAAATAINCLPLEHVDTFVAYQKPLRIDGLEAYIMPDSLSPGVLQQAQKGVTDALQRPGDDDAPSPLLALAERTKEWFGAPYVIVIR